MTSVSRFEGMRFGSWLVLSRGPNSNAGKAVYLCRCDCGTEKYVVAGNLKSGLSTGCGHDKGDRIRASKVTHGALANGQWHPLYNTWRGMHSRCYNVKNGEYENYGGRGIAVCAEWFDFNRFAADMGPKPTSLHSIDRKDNKKGYTPENCRWATKSEQSENRRVTKFFTHNGVTQSVAAWARSIGLEKGGLYARLRKGMTFEQAIAFGPIQRGKYERKRVHI